MLLKMTDERAVRACVARMPEARHQRLESPVAGVGADGCDEMRPNESGAYPGAIADPVDASAQWLQRVVTDAQAQQAQMLANGAQPLQARLPVGRDHDGVIHVAAVVGHFQRALGKVVQRVQVQVGKGLAHQVADGNAQRLRALRKQVQQPQGLRALDDALHDAGQYRAIDAVEELAHVHVQCPGRARGAAHGGLQPIGGGMRAQPGAACKVGADVAAIEDRADDGIDRVLRHQVAKGRCLDQARFAAVVDPEAVQRPGLIRAGLQLVQQGGDLCAEVALEQETAARVALLFARTLIRRHQRRLGGVQRKQVAKAPHGAPR